MLRFLTAGESHGEALVAILDGLPAGLALTRDAIEKQGHDDVVLWSPTPEQPLPPYWMNRYMEISPGVWVPDDRPSPPGSVHPA